MFVDLVEITIMTDGSKFQDPYRSSEFLEFAKRGRERLC